MAADAHVALLSLMGQLAASPEFNDQTLAQTFRDMAEALIIRANMVFEEKRPDPTKPIIVLEMKETKTRDPWSGRDLSIDESRVVYQPGWPLTVEDRISRNNPNEEARWPSQYILERARTDAMGVKTWIEVEKIFEPDGCGPLRDTVMFRVFEILRTKR